MAGETIQFDNNTPSILDANNIRSIMGIDKETGLVGNVVFELFVNEAGKKVGDAVKIVGNELPTMANVNKRFTVTVGADGLTLYYNGIPFQLNGNSVADFFWDALAEEWQLLGQVPLPLQEVTSDPGDSQQKAGSQQFVTRVLRTAESIEEKTDALYNGNEGILGFTDEDGHLIASLDDKGMTAVDFITGSGISLEGMSGMVIEQGEVIEQLGAITEDIIVEDRGATYFVDSNHNIIAIVDDKGVKSVSYRTKDDQELKPIKDSDLKKNFLSGTEFFMVADSLGAGGQVATELARLSNATFDQSKNFQNLSYGGTASLGKFGGQERMLKLKQLYPEARCVFYENINDFNYNNAGNINNEAWMLSQVLDSNQIYSDLASANNNANILNEINAVPTGSRKVGTVVNMRYYTSGKNLAINSIPTSNGNATITVGGAIYSISVSAGESVASIVDKIIELNFANYNDDRNLDGKSVDFTTFNGTAPTVVFNANGTGISAVVTDSSQAVTGRRRAFISKNIAEWSDTAKWVIETTITSASIYKGLISFFQTNFPESRFIWFIPTRYMIAWNPSHEAYDANLWHSDGSFNMDYYRTTDNYTRYQSIVAMQKAVCKLMAVQYIDCNELSGMTPYNLSNFYPQYNVHPLDPKGYVRWAQTIFDNI